MQTIQAQAPETHHRLPLSAMGAAFIAFAALGLTTGEWVLLGLLGFGLILSFTVDTRFDGGSRGVWFTRIALYAWVGFRAWNRFSGTDSDSIEILIAYAAAEGAASELVIQAWLQKPFGGARGAVTVLLSGVVLMGASNTFEASYIRFFVPVYMLCLAFSLRSFGAPAKARTLKVPRRGLAMLSIVFAVTAGAGLYVGVWVYRYEIGRIGMRLFNERMHAEAVGISTDPHLGETFGESGSLSRVLRLENWPATEQYLRVMAFSTYGNASWSPLLEKRHFTSVSPVELHANAKGNRARIDRLIDDEGLVVAPLNSAGINPPAGAELEWATDTGGPLRSKDPAPFPFVYEVVLPAQPNHQGPLCTPPSREEKARCLAIPDEIPLEVHLLAENIGGGYAKPLEQVHAVEKYLMETNQYSAKTHPGPGDPTSNFLLQKKAAHCEYFASAAAMLLRCLGVPTRYVIGYYVHEGDGVGRAIVRLRDAHAWCESWIDGVGWVTVDATPGGARPDQAGEPVPFWLKLRERIQDFAMLVRNTLAHLGRLPRDLLIGAGVLVVLVLALRRLLQRRERAVQPFRYSSSAALVPLARRFEKLMQRRGVPCPPHRTWREHLDTLAADSALAANLDMPAAYNFLRVYNRARFAGTEPTAMEPAATEPAATEPAQPQPADIARLHEVLRHLEANANAAAPASQRTTTKG